MKKWLFLLSAIIELIGSLTIYFNSELIFNNLNSGGIESRLYAVTMFSFAITLL